MLLFLACSAEDSPMPVGDYWKDFEVFEPEYDGTTLPLTAAFLGNKTVIDSIHSIDEASGLVISKRNKGMAWTVNDSGNDPELILIDLNSGEELCRYADTSLRNIDWEDIASYTDKQGASWVIIADIGDNLGQREQVQLLYVPEPLYSPDMKGKRIEINLNATIRSVIYPTGSKDAEAVFIDPARGDVYIISKRDNRSGVYALPFKSSFSGLDTAVYCGSFPFNMVTAADISMHGQLVIRTYLDLFYWDFKPGSDLRKVMASTPKKLPYDQSEPQGESFAFSDDGRSYYLLGEKLFNLIPVFYRWD